MNLVSGQMIEKYLFPLKAFSTKARQTVQRHCVLRLPSLCLNRTRTGTSKGNKRYRNIHHNEKKSTEHTKKSQNKTRKGLNIQSSRNDQYEEDKSRMRVHYSLSANFSIPYFTLAHSVFQTKLNRSLVSEHDWKAFFSFNIIWSATRTTITKK